MQFCELGSDFRCNPWAECLKPGQCCIMLQFVQWPLDNGSKEITYVVEPLFIQRSYLFLKYVIIVDSSAFYALMLVNMFTHTFIRRKMRSSKSPGKIHSSIVVFLFSQGLVSNKYFWQLCHHSIWQWWHDWLIGSSAATQSETT